MYKLSSLIEALTILLKYGDPTYPTNCDHDVLVVTPGIDPNKVSAEDILRLKELGFLVTSEYGDPCFFSFSFGSN